MSYPYNTLFYPLTIGGLDAPSVGQSVLFMNAGLCDGLKGLESTELSVQQFFKPLAAELQAQGIEVRSEIPDGNFDYIFLCTPKNRIETQYLMAQAAKKLSDGGILVCAAANDAGGNRLGKFMKELGFEGVLKESKHKARVVWAQNENNLHDKTLLNWIESGAAQKVLDEQFLSQPGVYGWNKIDLGSNILTQHLPGELTGHGADFGSGYGFLSAHLLQQNAGIDSLCCIDADYRAVHLCQKNMSDFVGHKAQIKGMWEDLMRPVDGLKGLDWIVMNPPFHEGKHANFEIGMDFIRTAAAALKPRGELWMVANRKLPYEDALKGSFSKVKMVFEGQGFKVFSAIK